MYKISQIVQDCVNGCTANNLIEDYMHFMINYYVNTEHGQGTKYRCFVYNIQDLEVNLYHIIRENISPTTDVVITDITVKDSGEIIRVNPKNYSYSMDYFMDMLR